jgi:HSP20 family protein
MAEVKEAPRPKTENGPGPSKDIAPRATAAPMKSNASPFAYMRRFAEEMDQLFENFGLQTGLRMPSFLTRGHELLRRDAGFIPGEWSPQIDVLEREGQFAVRADLPGLSKEDVKVDVTDDLLTIQGERKQQKKEEREGYCYSECSYGSFYRAIPLPAGAEASKATAQFHNGVLEIAMPAPTHGGKKARRLEVREGK